MQCQAQIDAAFTLVAFLDGLCTSIATKLLARLLLLPLLGRTRARLHDVAVQLASRAVADAPRHDDSQGAPPPPPQAPISALLCTAVTPARRERCGLARIRQHAARARERTPAAAIAVNPPFARSRPTAAKNPARTFGYPRAGPPLPSRQPKPACAAMPAHAHFVTL